MGNEVKIFLSKYVLYCVILIFIESAFSTAYLPLLVALTNGTLFVLDAFLEILGCILLAFFFSGILNLNVNRWTLLTVEEMLNVAKYSLVDKPTNYVDESLKNEKMSAISSNAIEIINGVTGFISQYFQSFIKLVVMMAVIAVVISSNVWITVFLSFVISVCIIVFCSKYLFSLSSAAERNRVNLGGRIISGWDNLVLGNQITINEWKRSTKFALDENLRTRSKSLKANFFVHYLILIICYLPTIAIIIVDVEYRISENESYINVLLSFPMIIQALNSLAQFSGMSSSLPNLFGQIAVLRGHLEPLRQPALDSMVKTDQITVLLDEVHKLPSEIEELKLVLPNSGLVSVTGINGSGKTSLLLSLKALFGKRAFYLPSNNRFMFESDMSSLSTGQRMQKQLEILCNSDDVDILILDEWDANLDKFSSEKWRDMLFKYSRNNFLIIEVSHKN